MASSVDAVAATSNRYSAPGAEITHTPETVTVHEAVHPMNVAILPSTQLPN